MSNEVPMKRGLVDREGLESEWAKRLRAKGRPRGHGFNVTRLGHVALRVTDLERSVEFYTQGLGFEVSDIYPETMMPGGMAFLRFNADHHGIALIGGADRSTSSTELHHLAFEVGSLDEVVRARDHLRGMGAVITFEGRRRAGCGAPRPGGGGLRGGGGGGGGLRGAGVWGGQVVARSYYRHVNSDRESRAADRYCEFFLFTVAWAPAAPGPPAPGAPRGPPSRRPGSRRGT